MHRTLSVDSKQEFRPQIGDFINGIDPQRTSKLTSLYGKPHMRSEGHRN